jgi:nucleotide-binding universal stress UspA family protein
MSDRLYVAGGGRPLPRREALKLLAAGTAAAALGAPRPARAAKRPFFDIRATQECGWNVFLRKGWSTDPKDIGVNYRHLDHLREAGLNWLLVFWTNAPEFKEAWKKASDHAHALGLKMGRAIYGFAAGGPETSMAEPDAPARLLRPSAKGPATAICPNEPEGREWMAGILAKRLEPGIDAIVIEPARETGRNCICKKCREMRPFEWDAMVINFLAERLVRLKPDVKIMLHLSAVNADRAAKRVMARELVGLPRSVEAMFAWGIDDEAAVTDWLDAAPRFAAFTKLSRVILFPDGALPQQTTEQRVERLFRWCRLAADRGKTAYSFDWRLFGGREWKGHEAEPPTTRQARALPASLALMGAALRDPYLDAQGRRELLASLRSRTEWDVDDPAVFYRGMYQ